MLSQPPDIIKIFFSYAHKDEPLRDELSKHLSPLKRAGQIEEWHDRLIVPGTDWATVIDERLNSAHIILLLISADFIASEYCWGVEVERALERHSAREARVIPVILRAVDWAAAPFSNLQALPTDVCPVTSWPNRDEAFADVVKGIRVAIEELRGGSRSPHTQWRPEAAMFQVPHLLPYLCDRSEHEDELRHSLRRHQTEMPRRPFLCFVHGDQDECHGEFLERLQHLALPEQLNLKSRGLSVEDYTLPWPSEVRSGCAAETFRSLLGLSLLNNSSVPAEEVFNGVPLERPVMLLLRLKTDDLSGRGLSTLSAFLDVWNDWPDLPVGRTLMCVISVRHQRFDRLSFFRRRGLRRVGEDVRRFIKGLDLKSYKGLCGVVLPELRAITRQDVVKWSDSKEVRAICRINEDAIDSLFEKRAPRRTGGPIPMQALAGELEQLVIKYRR